MSAPVIPLLPRSLREVHSTAVWWLAENKFTGRVPTVIVEAILARALARTGHLPADLDSETQRRLDRLCRAAAVEYIEAQLREEARP